MTIEAGQFDATYRHLVTEYQELRAQNSTDDTVGRLLNTGIVVIPNFLASTEVASMRAAIPPLEACRLSPEGTLTRFYSDAHEIQALAGFYDNEFIRATMSSVLGERATRHRAVVQYRIAIGRTGSFEQFFHIDTWRPRYKAFLYLTDVDEHNGPFIYTPGTHFGVWRESIDHEIYTVFRPGPGTFINDEASAFVGCFWPHQYDALCSQLATAPHTVTGGAGTLILFDARGLHSVRPLDRSPRIILYSHWIREGEHT